MRKGCGGRKGRRRRGIKLWDGVGGDFRAEGKGGRVYHGKVRAQKLKLVKNKNWPGKGIKCDWIMRFNHTDERELEYGWGRRI